MIESLEIWEKFYGGDWAVASECEARGPGLETVRAGQSGEFVIVSKNGQGEVVKKGKELFQVRVRSGNTDKAVEVVREREEGIFKCTYQTSAEKDAKEKELSISVMLRGGHVKGSPFTVKIITQPPQFLPQYCGQHLKLSQNNTVVTKSGADGWNAAVLADNGNNNNGILTYRVKIIISAYNMVGFASKSINKDGDNSNACGFYLYTNGSLYSQRGDSNKPCLGRSCYEAGTVIECVLDTVKHEIWFGVNGDKPQLAYQDVPADVIHLALNFRDQGSSFQLLE